MKAAVCEKYGPPEVFEIKDVPEPIPGSNEFLVKVYATTANAADCNLRGLTYVPSGLGWLAKLMLGVNKPKINIQGSGFAGIVEKVGKEVTRFKPGDKVYGTGPKLGGYAEFTCKPADGAVALMPQGLTFEEAAVLPYGALTAYYFLHEVGEVSVGQSVLVNGASGGVGLYAVQLAKAFGADVTGVCSKANLDVVKSFGADKVIDYEQADFSNSEEKYDVILDVVVGKTSFSKAKKVLKPKGKYLAVAGGIKELWLMIYTSVLGGKKVIFGGGEASEKREYLLEINRLIEQGNLTPLVDRVFTLDDIVAAHYYIEAGAKKGNVAVKVT